MKPPSQQTSNMASNHQDDFQNLRYRAEGNSSIVLTTGDYVYRLLKKHKQNAVQETKDDVAAESQKQRFSFIQEVMKPLLGPMFVYEGDLVHLSEADLSKISEIISTSDRPNHRLDKILDVSCPYAVRMPDLCFVRPGTGLTTPTLAIELKPKGAFVLGTPPGVKEAQQICRYCNAKMNRQLKNPSYEMSHYCPVDMYSGERSRMFHAIKMLLETPQNNLRIFKDGRYIYGEGHSDIKSLSNNMAEFVDTGTLIETNDLDSFRNEFCELLAQCLLLPLNTTHVYQNGYHQNGCHQDGRPLSIFSSQSSPHIRRDVCVGSSYRLEYSKVTNGSRLNGYHVSDMCHKESHGIPRGCVLDTVLCAQYLGYPGALHFESPYRKVLQYFSQKPGAREASCIDGPYNAYCKPCEISRNNDINSAIDKIKHYLVSRSATDCSILIALQQVPKKHYVDLSATHHILRSHTGAYFVVNIGIVDLDPKSIDSMPKFIKQETDRLRRSNYICRLDESTSVKSVHDPSPLPCDTRVT